MDAWNNITKLDLSSNKLTSKAEKILKELIISPSNKKLSHLILDNNPILDNSVSEIAEGLGEKYKKISEENNCNAFCPIDFLSLRKTGIGDEGLKKIVYQLDYIAANNPLGVDYKNFLSLDLSENDITDYGIKLISKLLPRFNAVSILKLANLPYLYF